MTKSRKLEELLTLLNQIQGEPTSESAIATLQQVINSKYAVAVARAAKLVCKSEIQALVPDLVFAFDRFMSNPATTDPNCLAKTAIAEALYRLESRAENLFLKGIHHVQMESVYGGKVDTAPSLRGVCALGLVRMNYPEVMVELADLLADPESEARIVAARAIAYSENPQGVPLLRLKVRVGDPGFQVLSECFIALLKLAPAQSLPLVASFLDSSEAQLCEMAALALGESRLHPAFPPLRDWWQRSRNPELRRTALLAIAMLRHADAIEFLLSLIPAGKDADVQDAIAALGLYQHDRDLWQRVCQYAEQHGKAHLLTL